MNRPEPPRQSLVLGYELLILGQGGRAYYLHLAPREGGLEDIGRVGGHPHRASGAYQGMSLVYEKYYVLPFLYLFYYLLYPVLEHAPEDSAGDDGIHLQIHYLLAAEPLGHPIRLKFDLPGQPFDDGRLPDARLAYYHHGITPLHVAEYLHDLLYLPVAAYYQGKLVVTREFVEVYGKVLKIRRKVVLFLGFLVGLFLGPDAHGYAAHDVVRVKPETPEYLCRKAVVFLKYRHEEVGGINLLPAPSPCFFLGEFKDVFGGRRYLKPEPNILAGNV